MIKVFIVDDHVVVRKGIGQILSDEGDIVVVGEASNADNILELYDIYLWDILILDVTIPGKNGLDSLIELKNKKPASKVLILSMHSDEEVVKRAFKTGADGYLNKDSAPEELIKALKHINCGRKYIGSSIIANAKSLLSDHDSKERYEELSDREFEVFCLLASGHSLRDIAHDLSISTKTVSTYRSRIMEKFDLKTNIDLVHYALKHRLILPL